MATFSSNQPENTKEKPRLYNPYKDLNNLYGNPIQTLYNLPSSPEFVFHEESLYQRRTWGENLQFYTGSAFLVGATGGALAGAYSGLKAAEAGESLKLLVNRVLNSGGLQGRRFGSTLGCLGLIFSGFESGVTYLRGGNDGALNSVFAGLGTGILYRAAAGPRSAAIYGAVGGLVAGAVVLGKKLGEDVLADVIADAILRNHFS